MQAHTLPFSIPYLPSPISNNKILFKKGKFYATFGRPIFKTILIAILTYQFAYYAWIRLEQNEIKADMNAHTYTHLEENHCD
ncbi:hypothetical protein F5X96DRAFT_673878 [Biscogniauxia mediterranea]|nr:hypothetical protein F5X96DRAFT_673878 [Biscogniauxia mediterranea]